MRAPAAVILGVACALGVAWLAWRIVSTPPRTGDSPHADAAAKPVSPPASSLPVPQSDDEKQRERCRRSRVPFMNAMQHDAETVGATIAVEDDLAELVVTLPASTEDLVSGLRDRAITLGAAENGFNRIRFMVADPERRGKPPVLVAEVTRNADGRWITFLR